MTDEPMRHQDYLALSENCRRLTAENVSLAEIASIGWRSRVKEIARWAILAALVGVFIGQYAGEWAYEARQARQCEFQTQEFLRAWKWNCRGCP